MIQLKGETMSRYADIDWIIQNIERWRDELAKTYGENDEYVLCLGEVLMKLDDTPTADVVERKRGEWLENETSYSDDIPQTCTCSVCGARSKRPIGYFCKWCGADLRERSEDEA